MEWTDLLSMFFRWVHIIAGILWIGHLYWFNFVNIPFAATMDADTKKKVVPELIPRALWWFRMQAALTWVTGLLLLGFVFYMGKQMFPDQMQSWTTGGYVMLAVTFLLFPIYDFAAKSALGKDNKQFAALSFVVVVAVVYLYSHWAGFGYRAYNIHLGAMFGTLMAANVWMVIWPGQQKVIPAIKAGTPPDAAIVAKVGQRSRHNTYMSLPLVWAMINAHTVAIGEENWYYLPVAVLVGWLVCVRFYKFAGNLKGM